MIRVLSPSTFKCIFVLFLVWSSFPCHYLLCLSRYHYINASLHLKLFWERERERECIIKNFPLFLSIATTTYTKWSHRLTCSLLQLIITTCIFILRRHKFQVTKKLCKIKFEHVENTHRLHFISPSKFARN